MKHFNLSTIALVLSMLITTNGCKKDESAVDPDLGTDITVFTNQTGVRKP